MRVCVCVWECVCACVCVYMCECVCADVHSCMCVCLFQERFMSVCLYMNMHTPQSTYLTTTYLKLIWFRTPSTLFLNRHPRSCATEDLKVETCRRQCKHGDGTTDQPCVRQQEHHHPDKGPISDPRDERSDVAYRHAGACAPDVSGCWSLNAMALSSIHIGPLLSCELLLRNHYFGHMVGC